MPQTKILKVSERLDEKDIENLKLAASVLRNGGLVAFPTETVYGLGANALDEKAVRGIFEAKGRPQDNPLIVHLSDISKIEDYSYANETPGFSDISLLFPAPLTVVVKKKDIIPSVVSAGLDTAGFRIPENKIARKFIELCGVPVAAPSANLSGRPSPTRASHVIEDMTGRADIIIDGGNCGVGVESTIVTLAKNPPVLLRPGGISYGSLCAILGEVAISPAILEEMKDTEIAAAPGMKYRHYAPKAPVTLVIGESSKACEYINKQSALKKIAVLCFNEEQTSLCADFVLPIGAKNDIDEQGRNIFDALRATDGFEDLEAVFARTADVNDGMDSVGFAIYNRLLKASGFTVVRV